MFEVTLKALRTEGACFSGYNKVVRALQGREFTEDDDARISYIRFAHKDPISIESIVASNGLDDALWALRCVEGRDRDIRMFAVWCARQVEHLMMDERSKNALNVVERLANGLATQDEFSAARAAARAAAWAAAGATRAAAGAAAWAAARAAADAAAEAAAWAAAGVATGVATWAATWAAARGAQIDMILKVCRGQAPWQVQQSEGEIK